MLIKNIMIYDYITYRYSIFLIYKLISCSELCIQFYSTISINQIIIFNAHEK